MKQKHEPCEVLSQALANRGHGAIGELIADIEPEFQGLTGASMYDLISRWRDRFQGQRQWNLMIELLIRMPEVLEYIDMRRGEVRTPVGECEMVVPQAQLDTACRGYMRDVIETLELALKDGLTYERLDELEREAHEDQTKLRILLKTARQILDKTGATE